MGIMVFLILIGVAAIDGKLWKLMLEQQRHNKAIEQLLADKLGVGRAND